MINRRWSLVLLLVFASGCAPTIAVDGLPPLHTGSAITARDIESVAALARSEGAPWIIDTQWGCHPALCELATVFLVPEYGTPSVRRGRAVELIKHGFVRPGVWRINTPGAYPAWAQIARAGESFGTAIEDPQLLSPPFRIIGEMSDADLTDAVRFFRSEPAIPDWALPEVQRRSVYFVSGEARVPPCTIHSVTSVTDGTVEVHCRSRGPGPFTLARREQQWEIVGASLSISF